MKHTSTAMICFALAIALATPVAHADELFRVGTKQTTRGKVEKITRSGVEFKPRAGAAISVPADEISRIKFDGERPELNRARGSESSGLYERALEGYTGVLGSLRGEAKKDTQYLIARTKAKMAITDPSKKADAIASLEKAIADHPNHFRYWQAVQWLGRVHAAHKDFPAANARFDELEASPLKSYKMSAKVAKGRVLLSQNKPAEAEASFEGVVAMQPSTPTEKASRYEAILGKARCQQLQSRFGDAVKLLDDIVKNTTAEDSELQARAFLQKGDCFRGQNQPKWAILEYLKVALVYEKEKGPHAEALYQLVQLWPQVRPERAAGAAAELRRMHPNSEWTKKLSQ